jgi:hypothetical protein
MKITAKRRFTNHGRKGKPVSLREDHKAVVEATSLFPKRVTEPDTASNLFKSGANNRKIGSHVTKGSWAGMPIFTLTLEERATCPRVCEHYLDCYGNHSHWPTRWKAGVALEQHIPAALGELAKKYPDGFVVRLHQLGDFYSRRYVQLWMEAMATIPQLCIYGYTRREKDSPEGKAVEDMNRYFNTRSKIRWSERKGAMGTHTTADVTARGMTEQGIVCPAQTEGDEISCGSCSLCWSTDKRIVFISH